MRVRIWLAVNRIAFWWRLHWMSVARVTVCLGLIAWLGDWLDWWLLPSTQTIWGSTAPEG